MSEQDEMLNSASLAERPEPTAETPIAKKPFVEPEVSVPVDVLEATTFFQVVDSGVVPPPGP